MNKYLIMTAAALAVASTAVATDASAKGSKSGSATIAFLTSFGSYSYCDTVALSWNGAAAAGVHDFVDGCGFGGISHEAGQEGKVKGMGKVFAMGDNFYAYYYGINWVLQYTSPPRSPRAARGRASTRPTAVTNTEYNSGGYITEGAAAKHVPMKKGCL